MPEETVIEFVGPSVIDLGLTGAFNTFRKGSKWFELLRINDEPLLDISTTPKGVVHAQTRAVVTGLDIGPLDEMLAKHAHANNAIRLGRPSIPDYLDAQIALQSILSRIYGVLDVDEEFTVISLARLTSTPCHAYPYGNKVA